MSEQFSSGPQKASYGIGLQLGEQLAANPFEGLDANAVAAGVIDVIQGNEPQVDREAINDAFAVLRQEIEAKQAEAHKGNVEAGENFLAENAKKDGVTVLESGLQYEVLTEGSGDKPSKESTVRTHYHGTLIDGTVFDSSVDRGEPAEFPVGGVIAGWTEALQLMATGSKWRLTIPHNLAYGERGAGGAIGPFSTLVFDVELLEIV